MAQKRLRNYKNPITSFEHNIANLGLHNPGRYVGFDTLVRTGALAFNISHAATGISYKNPINTTVGPQGVYLTPQGNIIIEETPITGLTVDTNAGNTVTRYDLLVATHNFVNVAGGQAATYSIIKGTVGSEVKPIPTDPFKQTPIGIIEFPPGAADVALCIYTKFKAPDSGDGEDARITTPNAFQAIQLQKLSPALYNAPTLTHINGITTVHLLELKNDGNMFSVLPSTPMLLAGIKLKDTPLQEGARITIMANSNVTFAQSYFWVATYGTLGYKAFTINAGLTNVTAQTGFGNLALRPAVSELWEMEFVFYGNQWYLARIGGAGTSSSFRRGDMIEWYGDVNANFPNDGMGINLQAGWALCNGNNLTPDLRGKLRAMATNVPSIGATELDPLVNLGIDAEDYVYGNAYTTLGKTKFAIGQANLPIYNLPVSDPGHSHSVINSNSDSGSGKFTTGSDASEGGTLYTQANTTGISVASGGSNTRLEHLPPLWLTVVKMKL